MLNFKLAEASIIGKSHIRMGYNNQDAYRSYQSGKLIVGLVCDGCGAYPNSEVGAQLGCRYLTKICVENFENAAFDATLLQEQFIQFLQNFTALQAGGEQEEADFVRNHLMFTIVGFVMKSDKTSIFSAGDGCYVVNNQVKHIKQNNRPHYIAKNLLPDDNNPTFQVEEYNTSEIQQLLVATDGLEDVESYAGQQMPTRTFVHSITEMLQSNPYYDSPAALPKYLTELQSILLDDTTVIMIQRG